MLSVIIPTRNRANLLQLALQSLVSQTLSAEQFEILIIDNGSTDATKQISNSFRQQLKNCRYVFDPAPGLHVARHRGLLEARGDILVYADDDIQATPFWLEAIAENFAEPSVAMVGGNNYPIFMAPLPKWLEKLWHQPLFGGQSIPALSILSLPEGRREFSHFLVWGCNFSIRKQILLAAGGFHPDAMPQELIRFRGDGETHVSQFILNQGLICMFDSRASVHHAVPPERMTIDYFGKRAFLQAISDSYTQLRSTHQSNQKLSLPEKLTRKIVASIKTIRDRLPAFKCHDDELHLLNQAITEGYKKGFAYHQKAYQIDPEVRAWVHKTNYY
ncbi:hypothetical protein BJL95_20900 [Methylomonas sp. LWB]|nr:hypothetical protein BJL95_20900 [Methylomonas sp. LWB]